MANFLDSTPLSGFFYNPEKDQDKIDQGIAQGTQAWNNLTPTAYENVDYQGPEAAADIRVDPAALERVGPTAMNDVSVDPRYKDQQLAQLSALAELRDKGGLNLTDKANLQGIQNDEAAQAQAGRASILQQAQMRGTGGGNLAIMDMLNANQGSANRQSQRDMQIAGMAQDRALQAGNMAATQSAGMSKQDFDQQAQVAAARDTAAKFNSSMANTNNQFNANQNINVQQANQQKNQGVNNATALAKNNSQTMNRYTMPTQSFAQGAQKASGQANVGLSAAEIAAKQQSDAKKAQSGLWGGAFSTGMGLLDKFGGGGGSGVEGGDSSKFVSDQSQYSQPFTSNLNSGAAGNSVEGSPHGISDNPSEAAPFTSGLNKPTDYVTSPGMNLTSDEAEKKARLAGLQQVGGY